MSREKEYVTTKEQFDYFVGRCEFWLDHYGVTGWEVRFEHNDDYIPNISTCRFHLGAQRSATVILTKSQSTKLTKDELDNTAEHEALELLLANLEILGPPSPILEKQYDATRHEVIFRLQAARRKS